MSSLLLLLWVALGLAAPEPSTAAPDASAASTPEVPAAEPAAPEAPTAPVIPSVTAPCGVDLPTLVQRVTAGDDAEAVVCMAAVDEAGPALLGSAAVGGPGEARLTTALAIWRLQRLDEAIPPVEARLFSPADRRLLRDGVQARRGRKSPSPDHEAVFSKFSWYKPVAGFTPGRLSAQDKENMATLDKPPAEPKAQAPAAEAMAEAQAPAAEPAKTESSCGCASGGGAGSLIAGPLGALAAALMARRRGRSAGQ